MPELRTGGGSESGRFYVPGNPATMVYEVMGKTGKYRSANVRDARANNWCVSVSEVIRQVAQPGLERWKRQQIALAALTHPAAATVTDTNALLAMIEKDSQAEARKAAEKGTAIHKAIEQYFLDGRYVNLEYLPYIDNVVDNLSYLAGVHSLATWKTETAATHPLGYGGRVDLYSQELGMVVDFKGKEFDETWKPEAYPEQAMQLAAYRELVLPSYHDQLPNQARCINLFISRNVPGLVKAYEWEPSDIERAWKEFKCLLEFWRVRHGF